MECELRPPIEEVSNSSPGQVFRGLFYMHHELGRIKKLSYHSFRFRIIRIIISLMRQLRQLLYGIFYILVWGAIAYGVYFFVLRVPPTCSDGVQNGREKGIDCGGKCNLVCLPPALQAIRISEPLQILSFMVGGEEKRASVFFEIQNPNEDAAARSFSFTINWYGPSSIFLGTKTGTSFIYEREVKHIVLPNIELPRDTMYGEVVVGIPNWVDAEMFRKPELSVREGRVVSSEGWIRAEGVLVNNDTVILPTVSLSALFYNTQGNIVAVSAVELDQLKPHEPRTFSIAHPVDARVDLGRVPQVVAEAVRPE